MLSGESLYRDDLETQSVSQRNDNSHHENNNTPSSAQNNSGKSQKAYDVSTKQVIQSKEPGFEIENKDKWFSEEEFHRQITKDLKSKPSSTSNLNLNNFLQAKIVRDKLKISAYRKAIESNPASFKDKIVLDMSNCLGIYSLFAAKAGAKQVYFLVENPEVQSYAKEIISANGFEKQISLVEYNKGAFSLPVDKVDVIISEWMGTMLLADCRLDEVIDTRDKYLNKNGLMFPDRVILNIAAIEDSLYKGNKIYAWENLYGVDMSSVQRLAMSEPVVDACNKAQINSSVSRIAFFDLYSVKKDQLEFSNSFYLTFLRHEKTHALITWFDVFFENLPTKASFSTGPLCPKTHWLQTVFYLERDLNVSEGEIMKGSFAVRKSKEDPLSSLDVKISLHQNGYHQNDLVQMYKLRKIPHA